MSTKHYTIDEAIKRIKAKTGQALTYREIAELYKKRKLKVCFEWIQDDCRLVALCRKERFDLLGDARITAVRTNGELYLIPSFIHEPDIYRAIKSNLSNSLDMYVVRVLGGGRWREWILTRGLDDDLLYSLNVKFRGLWWFFTSSAYFGQLEKYGPTASYKITIDELLITEESLYDYIDGTKAESTDTVKVINENSDPMHHALQIATQIMGIIPSENHVIVTKAQLARAILAHLRGLGYRNKVENEKKVEDVEASIERSVGRWIDDAKPKGWGGPRRPTNEEIEQSRVLICDAFADLLESDNRQN